MGVHLVQCVLKEGKTVQCPRQLRKLKATVVTLNQAIGRLTFLTRGPDFTKFKQGQDDIDGGEGALHYLTTLGWYGEASSVVQMEWTPVWTFATFGVLGKYGN